MIRSLMCRICIASLILFFMSLVTAPAAFAKGNPHDIEFVNGTEHDGEIKVEVETEKDDGSGNTDIHYFQFYIENPPVDEIWKADQLYDKIEDNSCFDARYIDDNRIQFWIADDCSQYKDIVSVTVIEDNDESVIVDDDPLEGVPIVVLSLDITGTGQAGTFTFGIAHPAYPQVTVPTTGLTGDQIEDNLISDFNIASDHYTAQRVGGLIVVENVPCPLGVLAGTTDTALVYAVKLTHTGMMTTSVPSLQEWGFIVLAILVLLSGGIIIVRRRRLETARKLGQ